MISTYTAALLADIAILGLGALSVYVILSTGQLSLGNGAFMGIGAYISRSSRSTSACPSRWRCFCRLLQPVLSA